MVRSFPFSVSRRAVLVGGLAAVATPLLARGGLTIMAAASLKPALDEIAANWEAPVAISYGGSGTIARQAAAGAPADIVILAATDWMDWLVAQGAVEAPSVRAVAGNRLVLAGPLDARPLALNASDIAARLGANGRFAMGDPMSVPAGRYGQQALETLGLWSSLGSRVILAENVRAALAYIVRGDVELGLVYRSDTRGTGAAIVADIPAESHAPITYPAALLPGATDGAAVFLAQIATATDIFARHGFGQ
ncbi:MAG: molybdate ABC transporter substrate-binding protein [Pseudomonadota bacterium]